MMIAKNDEEKRSKIWRYVTTIATIIIIVVAAYFLFTLFAGNPLLGTWVNKENDMELVIRKSGGASVTWSNTGEAGDLKLNISYALSKGEKTISFRIDQEEIEKAIEASGGKLAEDTVIAEADALENTFSYNLSSDKLTLSEREYGEQRVFVKK